MNTIKQIRERKIRTLVTIALLSAIVAVLSYFGGFIKIGGLASISLTLIPVVLGGALYGCWAGAWLGFVSAIVFFITPDAAFWFGLNTAGTLITVIVKGTLAGACAGLVNTVLKEKNEFVAVLVSSIVAPVVNTGIFLIGCLIFFKDVVNAGAAEQETSVFLYLILVFVGLNFVFELLANIILSPAILRMINLFKKKA